MRGALKKLTESQAAESVKMYDRGMSLAPIAAYFGVSRQAMWDLLRRRTTMRPQRRTGTSNHFHRGSSADDVAHDLVENAVRRGTLVRPSQCEKCGSGGRFRDGRTSLQAHHADYNKPLDVEWLCQRCHHAWHKSNVATPRMVAPRP